MSRLASLVLASQLAACVSFTPTIVSGPALASEGGEIVDERASLSCASEGAALRCVLEAEVEVELRSPELELELVTHGVDEQRLRDASGELPAEAESREQPAGDLHRLGSGLEAWRSTTHVVAGEVGERRRVHLRASFEPVPARRVRLAHSPSLARHMGLSEHLGVDGCAYERGGCEFLLFVGPRAPELELELELERAEVSTETRELAGAEGDGPRLRVVKLQTPRRMFHPGGPFFAMGVGFGVGGHDTPKLRAGWEVFVPAYLAHALAVELDGAGHVTLVPSLELMAPMLMILPSLGAGIGLPIELAPTRQLGVRAQLSAALPYLGLLATFDVFPGAAEPGLRPSLLLQFAL